ncbi:MAG: class II aldolase/adducin family protein [archaeon]
MDEGAIKFNCKLIKAKSPSPEKITELNKWRNKLFELKLIGAYKNGVGFGNISVRAEKNTFFVSGSGTGKKKKLTEKDYSKVIEFDFSSNSLTCEGKIKASSESLTHATIYESSPETNAVIHVHSMKLWKHLMNKVPFTRKEIEYGSPEMAEEMKKLLAGKKAREKKIIVMKGHKEGIISFGKTLDEAGNILLKFFEETK